MKAIMVTVPDDANQIEVTIWRAGNSMRYTEPVRTDGLTGIHYDESDNRWHITRKRRWRMVNVKDLKTDGRTSSKVILQGVITSIQAFGFTEPILIDSDNNVVVGHVRVEAARKLHMKEVPTITIGNTERDYWMKRKEGKR